MDPIFSTQELSAAISSLPTRIGNPGDVELFRPISGTTKSFDIEFYAENLILGPKTQVACVLLSHLQFHTCRLKMLF